MISEVVDISAVGIIEGSEFGDRLKKNTPSMPFAEGSITELISKRPRYDDVKKAFIMKFKKDL
jgi:hypothetical protein